MVPPGGTTRLETDVAQPIDRITDKTSLAGTEIVWIETGTWLLENTKVAITIISFEPRFVTRLIEIPGVLAPHPFSDPPDMRVSGSS